MSLPVGARRRRGGDPVAAARADRRDVEAHEDKTTNQIVVLTVPRSAARASRYATRVFDAWKLGQKGKDNGVLVLVVPTTARCASRSDTGSRHTARRRSRANIRTGSRRVQGRRLRGRHTDGVDAIVAELEGRGGATGDVGGTTSPSTGKGIFDSPQIAEFEGQLPPWPMRILLGGFIFGIIGLFTAIGVMTPGVGWFLYVFLIPFWAMFPIIVVGIKGALVLLGIYVVGFPLAKLIVRSRPGYAKAAADLKRTGHATFGGMVITSGGSSSSGSSGGSSGGGFSGGGGSSGGGGASGSW
jgi:uncharacterized protein